MPRCIRTWGYRGSCGGGRSGTATRLFFPFLALFFVIGSLVPRCMPPACTTAAPEVRSSHGSRCLQDASVPAVSAHQPTNTVPRSITRRLPSSMTIDPTPTRASFTRLALALVTTSLVIRWIPPAWEEPSGP